MPENLSRHFGHLLIRDPLVILEEFVHPADNKTAYHFEVSLFIFLNFISNTFICRI